MKIKGLLPFQRRMLQRCLAKNNVDGDFNIEFTYKISLRRLSSLWYGGGVAEIYYKGYVFNVEAIGDVYAELYRVKGVPGEDSVFTEYGNLIAYVKDKGNGGYFSNEIPPYLRSDKTLNKALGKTHPKYSLEMDYNNWWECFGTDPAGNFHDLMWNLGEDNLFLAIAEVLNGLDETIKNLEEKAS